MKKAVCYYRHSAEDKQENSISLQRERVEKFCMENGIKILGEELDDGVSGISAKRPGFQRLLNNWIENKSQDFDFVMVLDVSRWGRFQNIDEAAYYDFLAYRNNRKVVYVDRGLNTDPSQEFVRSIIVMIDRWSSGEFLRQLSTKVWFGDKKVIEQGYSHGGPAAFGLQRMLVDEDKKDIGVLKRGQRKSISNQRVRFVLDDEESSVVRRIFSLFDIQGYLPTEIAELLTEEGFTGARIRNILKNHRYAGVLTINKTSSKLDRPRNKNPTEEWVMNVGAIQEIVTLEIFDNVQKKLMLHNFHHVR